MSRRNPTRREAGLDFNSQHNTPTNPARVEALRKALGSGLLVRYTEALRAAAARGQIATSAAERPRKRMHNEPAPIADAIPGETYNGAAVVHWLRSTGRLTWRN